MRLMQPSSLRAAALALALACAGPAVLAQDAATSTPTAALALAENPDLHMVGVEALVVEIDEQHTRDLGLEYGFNPRTTDANGNPVLDSSSVLDGGNVTLGRALQPVRVPVLIKGLEGNTSIGFDSTRVPGLGVNLAGMNIDGQVVAARLRALLDEGEAVIRTRPIAVALNRTPVTIKTTNNIPYLDRKENRNLEINEKQVGIEMNVTPTIEDMRTRLVRLDIENLRVSSVSGYITNDNIDRPVINSSEAKSIITLREGETFVIGGLKTRRKVHQEDRVPVLSHIPLLGMLFTSQTDVERNLDVLFFITPYILSPGQNFLLPFDFRHQKALGIDVAADVQDR